MQLNQLVSVYPLVLRSWFQMEFVQPIKDKKDIQKMKDYLHKKNLRDYTLFTIGINSLLRVSDLLNLQLSDVEENGILKTKITMREQKTDKRKEFPFNSSIVEALKEYLSKQHNHKDSCLFPSRKWFNNEDFINREMIVEFLNPYINDLVPQIKQYLSIEEISESQEIGLNGLIQEFTEQLFNKIDEEVEKETNIKQFWLILKEFKAKTSEITRKTRFLQGLNA